MTLKEREMILFVIRSFVVILTYTITGCTGGSTCYQGSYYDNYDSDSYYTRIYCYTSCCGYYYYRYCCYQLEGAAVAGIVIGCLITIGIIVSIIVCVCCMSKRRQATQGVVYQQGQSQHVTYITQSNQGQQYPSYPQYPVVAGGQGQLNPAYSQENITNAEPPPGYHQVVRSN